MFSHFAAGRAGSGAFCSSCGCLTAARSPPRTDVGAWGLPREGVAGIRARRAVRRQARPAEVPPPAPGPACLRLGPLDPLRLPSPLAGMEPRAAPAGCPGPAGLEAEFTTFSPKTVVLGAAWCVGATSRVSPRDEPGPGPALLY